MNSFHSVDGLVGGVGAGGGVLVMQRDSPNELDRVVNERRPKETFFSDVETKIERSWLECIGEDDLGSMA